MRIQNERELRSLIDQRLEERSRVEPIAGDYQMNEADRYVLADATAAPSTITLPSAIDLKGREYTVIRTNSGANAVTVGGVSGQTTNGAATVSLSSQYDRLTVISDGSNWFRVD